MKQPLFAVLFICVLYAAYDRVLSLFSTNLSLHHLLIFFTCLRTNLIVSSSHQIEEFDILIKFQSWWILILICPLRLNGLTAQTPTVSNKEQRYGMMIHQSRSRRQVIFPSYRRKCDVTVSKTKSDLKPKPVSL